MPSSRPSVARFKRLSARRKPPKAEEVVEVVAVAAVAVPARPSAARSKRPSAPRKPLPEEADPDAVLEDEGEESDAEE